MQSIDHHEHWMKSDDGLSLFTQQWCVESPKAAVVIVHGVAEYSRRYLHVANFLNEHGFNAYAIDHRGHGRSEGKRVYVENFREYLRDLDKYLNYVRSQEGQRPLFLLGHSMGGAISTLYSIRNHPRIDGLILSGPALMLGEDISPLLIKLSGLLGRFLPYLPVQKLDHRLISRDPGVVANYAADPLVYHKMYKARFGDAFVRAVQEIQEHMEDLSLPLLLMHGTDDKLADPSGSQELYTRAHSPDKTLKLYDDLYHEIFNEPEKERVLHDMLSWLNAHI